MPAALDLLAPLRDANWLNGQRARAYGIIFGLVALVCAAGWVVASKNGLDPVGKPLGTDFTSFWAASKLALQGQAASVYDPAAHNAAQQAMFGAPVGYSAFFYPPVYLLICLPLALLPYLASLAAWLAVTGFAYWRTVKAMLGDSAGLTLPALAFPAVLINAGHGQNAFLTAALFGAGALLLTRRPVLAGICLGALVFKPHLGLLIPVALIAAGRWKTVFAAAATVTALCAASVAAFGAETWRGFFAVSPLARQALEQELVGSEKMQSVFAALRLWQTPLPAAYAAQALTALLAAAVLIAVARRSSDKEALGPAMIAAALLASPFLLDYDLVMLALPMAWVFARGQRSGFLPWEKLILAAAFVLPLVSRTFAANLGLPLGPVVIAAVFALVVRRAFHATS